MDVVAFNWLGFRGQLWSVRSRAGTDGVSGLCFETICACGDRRRIRVSRDRVTVSGAQEHVAARRQAAGRTLERTRWPDTALSRPALPGQLDRRVRKEPCIAIHCMAVRVLNERNAWPEVSPCRDLQHQLPRNSRAVFCFVFATPPTIPGPHCRGYPIHMLTLTLLGTPLLASGPEPQRSAWGWHQPVLWLLNAEEAGRARRLRKRDAITAFRIQIPCPKGLLTPPGVCLDAQDVLGNPRPVGLQACGALSCGPIQERRRPIRLTAAETCSPGASRLRPRA